MSNVLMKTIVVGAITVASLGAAIPTASADAVSNPGGEIAYLQCMLGNTITLTIYSLGLGAPRPTFCYQP